MKGSVRFRLTRWIGGEYYKLIGINSNLAKDEIRKDIGSELQEYLVVSGDIAIDTKKALEKLRDSIKNQGWKIKYE